MRHQGLLAGSTIIALGTALRLQDQGEVVTGHESYRHEVA